VFAWHTQHAARSLDVVAPGQQDFVRGSCVCACDQQRKLYVRHDWSDDSGVHFYSGVERVERVEQRGVELHGGVIRRHHSHVGLVVATLQYDVGR